MKTHKGSVRLIASILALFSFFAASAEKTPVENLYEYKLENGLSLFVAENHTVPLAYIEIAVKAGAITQTPETAGLFHLYEHMMFKGNSLYKDAASVNRALSNLGVASWNGSTGINHVNYFFTIPSDRLEEGLAFWNAAIRSPLIEERELQNEKKVVLSEIEGSKADPASVFYKYLNSRLFPDAPYKTDSGGSFEAVKNASVQQLRGIQSEYYIPSNAALFVGGDVNPDETYELVKKIFGSWSNNGNIPPKNTIQQNTAPFASAEFCVMPFDKITEELAQVLIQFRGPDADFNVEDTYAVDYLTYLLNEPDGIFMQRLFKDKELGIPDFTSSWAQFATVRANALIEFGTMMSDTKNDLARRCEKMLSKIQSEIIPEVLSEKKLYTGSYKEKIISRLKDSQAQSTETASGLLTSLRSWWVNTSADYFYSYYENLAKVTQEDVKKAAEKYLAGKYPLVSVLVNPNVYEETKEEFRSLNFYEISPDEKLWWQKDAFQPEKKDAAQAKAFRADSSIYIPESSISRQKQSGVSARDIETARLKNGIPVYINHTENKIISIAILCPGGVENLTPETSGLETTLFSFMSSGSRQFSHKKRTGLSYDTNASIGYFSKLSGSALYLNALDKHFEKMLPVFIDGFLHPAFAQDEYENTMNRIRQNIQSLLNNPEPLLSYTISDTVYKGHPYEAKTIVTPLSIQNITVENLKAHHRKITGSGNFSIVVSGKISSGSLLKKLEASIGKMKFSPAEKSAEKEIKPVSIESNAPVVLTHPSAEGTAYITRIFSSPANTSPDFIPCVLAGNMYTDILFTVVREHYGICYSPQSYVIGSKAPYGIEHLFKVSNFTEFAKAMKEARTYMAEGSIVEKTNEDGSYSFSTLESNLESYRNSYINQTYQSQETSAGQILTLGYNILQFNDINYDLKQLIQIKETSAADIKRVFKKYWIESPSSWFAITGPDEKTKLIFSPEQ